MTLLLPVPLGPSELVGLIGLVDRFGLVGLIDRSGLTVLVAGATVATVGWAAKPDTGRTSSEPSGPSPGPPVPAPPRRDRSAPPPPWAAGTTLGAVLVVATLTSGPVLALVLTVALVGARALLRRRHLSRRRAERNRALPDLIDLFVVAASAGHPVPRCLIVVAPRAPAVLKEDLSSATDRLDVGFPLRQVLADLGDGLGPLGVALTDALSSSLVTGASLGPALAEVAATARDHRRREAQIVARRLPVQLLLPLVCCILPAFALLAVVPLLAGSLGALDLAS